MDTLIAAGIAGYDLIDSGDGRKLERIAGALVERPSPQALWRPREPRTAWEAATSVCTRTKDGGGFWRHRGSEPAGLSMSWPTSTGDLRFALRFTAFGHCGVFVEQAPIWQQLSERVAAQAAVLGRTPRWVNLFGYTGCASLVLAAAGAEVYHVDSARGVLQWGRESVAASPALAGDAGQRVRWVHDDARRFVAHARKKGFAYDGVIADPPSWGHGAEKEVWQIEDHLVGLVADIGAVLNPGGVFVLTSHTPGVQAGALVNVISDGGRFEIASAGDLGVAHRADARVLPAGVFAIAAVKAS